MKAGILLASSIAFTMASSSSNALPPAFFAFEQTPAMPHLQLAMAEDIAPIIEPAYFGKAKTRPLNLRSSLPMLAPRSQDRLPLSLQVMPLDRPWRQASLTITDPMLMPAPSRKLQRYATPPRASSLPKVAKISLKRSTLAPMAYVKFCKANQAQCAMDGARDITLTEQTLTLLKKVNFEVNHTIQSRNEPKDIWQANVSVGDCEDFALTKRARLLKMGFSGAAMRMAVAKTQDGQGHAVLIVSTDRGDFVLDNRNNELKDYQKTDLIWVKIQGTKAPLLWHKI